MRSALAVLALSLAATPLRAAPGATGASFLKLGAGPRAVGMGEAHTAVADDAYASYWNPGGLGQLRHPELALMHNNYFEGVSQQYISYAHPFVGGNVLGLNVTRLSITPFESFNNSGARTGSVEASDLAVGVSAARAFSLPLEGGPTLGVGVNGKHLREKLGPSSASGMAADLGVWTAGWERVLGPWARGGRAGLAVRHVGQSLKFVSEGAPLPTTVAFGVAVERPVWGDPLLVALDVAKEKDDKASLALGAEYWMYRAVAARVGYKTGQDEGLGLRLGIGLRLYRVQVDYAFAGYGDLGSTHRIGLTFRFGGTPQTFVRGPEQFIEAGQGYLRQGRYYEAIVQLNQALDKDPNNAEALELLRQANTMMREGGGKSNGTP